jgi:hypothetical protein
MAAFHCGVRTADWGARICDPDGKFAISQPAIRSPHAAMKPDLVLQE